MAPRVVVNRETCLGFGYCVAEAPHSFELKDGKSHASVLPGDGLEPLLGAARRCPTDSIRVYDADGRPLAP
jgi:ferredoxin